MSAASPAPTIALLPVLPVWRTLPTNRQHPVSKRRDDHGVHPQRRYHVAHWAFRSSGDRCCDGADADEYCRCADNQPSVEALVERDERRLARDVRVAREVLGETLRAA